LENASKALIIAGGILIAILLISLFLYAWNIFSEYQNSKNSLEAIQNTSKFNEEFTQYDRNDVQGYELLSLINKVVDYNERKSLDTINGNDNLYAYITLTINMGDESKRKKFAFDDKNQLITKNVYEETDLTKVTGTSRPSFKKSIEDYVHSNLLTEFGNSEESASKIAKSIRSIFLTETEISNKANRKNISTEAVKTEMVARFNSLLPNSATKLNRESESDVNKLVLTENRSGTIQPNALYKKVCAYYEYMQFKRGVFECKSIGYDANNTGRVNSILFEFTGTIY